MVNRVSDHMPNTHTAGHTANHNAFAASFMVTTIGLQLFKNTCVKVPSDASVFARQAHDQIRFNLSFGRKCETNLDNVIASLHDTSKDYEYLHILVWEMSEAKSPKPMVFEAISPPEFFESLTLAICKFKTARKGCKPDNFLQLNVALEKGR